jgi:hypothetical protein
MATLRSMFAILLIVGFLSGCGDNRFSVVPVEGVVTLNGEPLPDAYVTFDPRSTLENRVAGPGSYGRTDAAGHYILETYDGRSGAVQAEHQVSIRTMLTERGADGRLKVTREELLPRRYHEDTELIFEVTSGGTKEANIDLKVKK